MADAALKQATFERIVNFLMLVIACYSLFIAALMPTHAYATDTAEIANIPAWQSANDLLFGQAKAGDTITLTTDANGRYINIKTPIDYKSTAGRVFQIVADKTAQIEASRMGKAVIGVVRTVSPIGSVAILGSVFVSLLCSETQICQKSGTDDLEKVGDSAYNGYPTETTYGRWFGWAGSPTYPSAELACGDPTRLQQNIGANTVFDHIEATTDPNVYKCYGKRTTDNTVWYASNTSRTANSCATGYTYNSATGKCVLDSQPHAVTEADLTAAEAKITSPNWDQILIDKGVALPVKDTPILQPLTQTLGTETTTNKDQAGNVIGTTTKTTSLTLNDSATRARPGSVSATETQTITNYNTSNQVINSTTVQTSAPPPEKPLPPITVHFDNAEDFPIETKDINTTVNSPTWGESTCPAPINVATSNNSFTIPTQPLCDFATGARPIVLVLATITSMHHNRL
ncbi:virulence factor TspB C-terminal domain-related protein [Nitrosomonas communis]|uniref:Uncharacterized protein n=1 Tax=Nitrosomonas communis TaxID=44574 RepID=A0A1I4PRZ5_9PROT|nr:virulence factor TspB C-terminal domain-related protein [Nitrosomonas communis]SFM30474.1 hypothetical protein SAMN05421863_102246 [Nitrosomonas communis]